MSPRRVQLRRTKGWRKPEGAVVVARPTKWGNPIRWANYPVTVSVGDEGERERVSDATRRDWAVTDFEAAIKYGPERLPGYPSVDEIRTELAGRDLACWCPLTDENGHPVRCHADVLLAIANSDG